MQPVFSIEESLRFGWKKTKEHSKLIFQVLLVLFALQVVSAIAQKVLAGTLIGGLASLALAVAGIIVGTGFTLIMLKIAKGEAVVFKDIVPPMRLVWYVFLASLLVGILTVAGLILLIIPGIYFALRFSMVRFAVLDGSGVMESFSKSTALTNGVKWPLLGFFAVVVLLNVLGAIALMIGLLITIPVTMIAFSHVYLQLAKKAPAAQAAAPAPMAHDHDHSDPNHTH
jgi:hypothetical protein